MTDLKSQRDMASRILKCGKSRVWFEPSRIADIEEAITAEDIRRLVSDDVIKLLPKKGLSSFRKKKAAGQKSKGRRKNKGSRKGSLGTRVPAKKLWVKRIRVLRKMLKELVAEGKLEKKTYRKLYRTAKSGYFRSRVHMMSYIEKNDMLKKSEKQKSEKKK
ncbi:MAG: 50S ribosomal protein L19e [Candidatus Aenigmarchaeota archaeon]|nr:50S ribosomal protein L19e [Candidatus Aenigmarchaeota archaeon]